MAPIILYYQFGKHQVPAEIAEESKNVSTKSVPGRALPKPDEGLIIVKPEAQVEESKNGEIYYFATYITFGIFRE